MNERGNVERSAMRIDSCFDDTGFDVTILGSSCVEDMAIEGESNDRIGCRVLLRWSDCDYSDLLRCFGWDDKFGSCRFDGRKMEFDGETHFDGTGVVVHEWVGRISE